MPDEVGLAAYRIVQESLSNARRHAPEAQVGVTIERGDGHLAVEVHDDGGGARRRPAASAVGDPGHGLLGMRERVDVLGGQFDAGPTPEGGWRVAAEIPLDGPAGEE